MTSKFGFSLCSMKYKINCWYTNKYKEILLMDMVIKRGF